MMEREFFTIEDAFAEAVIRDVNSLPPEDPFVYSIPFIKKMNKLLQKERRFYFRFTNTVGKRIAAAIIILAIVFGTPLSVEAARNAISGFFVDVYETFSRLTLLEEQKEEMKTSIEAKYTLAEVPDGYTLNDIVDTESLYQTEWIDSSGSAISLDQIAADNLSIRINTEDYDGEFVSFGDYEGVYFIALGYHNLVWTRDGYMFILSAPPSIDRDTFMSMAQNIKVNIKFTK